MHHLTIQALVFFAIELAAFGTGNSLIVTLACGGVFLCLGMQLGWLAWERSREKRKGGR